MLRYTFIETLAGLNYAEIARLFCFCIFFNTHVNSAFKLTASFYLRRYSSLVFPILQHSVLLISLFPPHPSIMMDGSRATQLVVFWVDLKPDEQSARLLNTAYSPALALNA